MLIHAEHSALLHVDLQVKLIQAAHEGDLVLANSLWLTKIANILNVPVMATVQYPAGLGMMPPEMSALIDTRNVVEKIHFSALADGRLETLSAYPRPQIILTGIESHVCVLQTALDLLSLGKDVFVVAEAVGSRKPSDRELALDRMRSEGCTIISREMAALEWLRQGGTDAFKTISKEYLR